VRQDPRDRARGAGGHHRAVGADYAVARRDGARGEGDGAARVPRAAAHRWGDPLAAAHRGGGGPPVYAPDGARGRPPPRRPGGGRAGDRRKRERRNRETRAEKERWRQEHRRRRDKPPLPLAEARARRPRIDWRREDLAQPAFLGRRYLDELALSDLVSYIDWQ